MIGIKNLKQKLYERFSGIRVYEQGFVPQDAVYPFVCYDIPISNEVAERDSTEDMVFKLQLDIIHKDLNYNTDSLEALINTIDTVLNRKIFQVDNYYVYPKREAIYSDLPTEDEYIFRRQLDYQLEVIENGE